MILFFRKFTLYILILLISVLVANQALALSLVPQPTGAYQCGGKTCYDYTVCDFLQIFVNGADIIVMLSGVMSVVMFVFGGIIMITAYGNEARVKWGKDVLIATVIGIVIVMLAWTLVNTVILALYGGSVSPAFSKMTGQDSWSKCPTIPSN